MNIWKNKVGRPTNEILAKRSAIKTIIFACLVLVVFTVTMIFNDFYGDKLKGAAEVSKTTYDITGLDGYGLVADELYYKGGTYINFDNISSGIVFAGDTGKRRVNVRVRFPRAIYSPVKKSGYLYPDYTYVMFTKYNSSGKRISSCPLKKVTSQTYDCWFTVDSATHYIEIDLYNTNMAKNSAGVRISSKRIDVAMWPTAKITAKSNLVKTSNDEYITTGYKTYENTGTIVNPSARKLYMRWITYKNLNMTASNVNYISDCISFSSKKYNINTISLTTNSTYPRRSGIIKVYSSYNQCSADSSGSKKNTLATATIKYVNSATGTNSYGYQELVYSVGKIGEKIGSQNPSTCISHSLAYGSYILGGKVSTYFPIGDSFKASCFGAYDKYAKSAQDLYNIIVAQLTKGIPVSIHVKNSSSQHWVLVVGYKNKGNKKLDYGNITEYLWAIDPYSSSGHGKKGSKVLSRGVVDKDVKYYIPSKNTGLKDLRYMSWTSASEAKACRR